MKFIWKFPQWWWLMIMKLSDKKLITQFKHIIYALLLTIITSITLVLVVSCETEPKPAFAKTKSSTKV